MILITLLGLIPCVLGKGDVLVITDDTYENALAEHQFLFVKFYAPWCGHSRRLGTHWIRIAKKLALDGSPVQMAEIDGTVEVNAAS